MEHREAAGRSQGRAMTAWRKSSLLILDRPPSLQLSYSWHIRRTTTHAHTNWSRSISGRWPRRALLCFLTNLSRVRRLTCMLSRAPVNERRRGNWRAYRTRSGSTRRPTRRHQSSRRGRYQTNQTSAANPTSNVR
jgi:hypothetical protein